MPNHILLIQGEQRDAKVIFDALHASHDGDFRVEWVRTCALGVARLTERRNEKRLKSADISAVLVDIALSDAAGTAVVARLVAAAPHVPVVILCCAAEEAVAKAAMHFGAQDFLLKEHLDHYVLSKTLAAAMERATIANALFDERERAQVTLNSIGDAVISTDIAGQVTYLNPAAERLTGWPCKEAIGRPLPDVFRIVDAETQTRLPDPLLLATNLNRIMGLPPSTMLVRRDGVETAIEDSCAPIHDRRGRIKGAVMVFHDVSAARALTHKLAYLAHHDSLTDLPNRALLGDRLTQAIGAAQRHSSTLAVLYLDLDRFKHINDSLGHAVGDHLLQAVALRLSENVRTSDTVSRLGGDEFVILLSDVGGTVDAAVCAEKLIQAVDMPYLIDGHELQLTASIGIATYPEDGLSADMLLHNADCAMYAAKDDGRNRHQFYRSDLNSTATERQSLESDLRHAIRRNELEVFYQPIMSLASGRVAGAETLLRWRHPAHGLLLPARFMAIAEESGLIVPIGQWVLHEACRQGNAWRQESLPSMRLAVNISAVELGSRDFVAGVTQALAQTGFDPSNLELELTETFLMQDAGATSSILDALKELGVDLALDDFGTGYSSLSHMRRFPIDALKIDRSFVDALVTDAADASVVRAVINLGKSLHMRVVAEGVETREQLSFLEKHDCPEAQGYLFSHPLGALDFAALLRRDVPQHARLGTPVA